MLNKAATAEHLGGPVEGPAPKVIMRPIRDLYLATEAPKGVNLAIRDAGRGSPMTDAELKASIYAKGIIYPLIVKTEQGKLYTVAGNRRLRFLREIFADALDSQVQTQNAEDFEGDWREVAMDTNLALPPHLVERYELIVQLSKDLKLSPEDARLRFGMTPRQYAQVMALGKMSPTIRKAWRDGEIEAKVAQIFTLEPDPKEQDRIFEAAKKQGHSGRVDDYDIRRRIVPENQRDAGKLVAFIGVDACKKAKIIKQEDLFSTSHLVTDMKALRKLAGDKLAEWSARLTAKTEGGGWAWAIPEDQAKGPTYYYGTLQPAGNAQPTAEEKKRLEELKALLQDDNTDDNTADDLSEEEERIEEAIKGRGFTAAQRAKSGCFLKIIGTGNLSIEYGKVKPEEKKTVVAADKRATTAATKAKAKKPGAVTLTNALAGRLSEQLQKAVAFSMVATPHVAVSALIAGFASDGHVVDVEVGGVGRSSFGRSSSEKNFVQVLDGALKATPESRVVMLAKVVAEALDIQINSADAKPPIEDKGLQLLIAHMNAKMLNAAIANTFDAKGYFDGVSLQACVDAVRCSMGDDHAAKVAKMKKGEAAKFAAANTPAKGWLPKELRTVHYTGPVETATPAAKKPAAKAPAKKAAKKAAKKKAK